MKHLFFAVAAAVVSFSAAAIDYTFMPHGTYLLQGDRLVGSAATLMLQHDGNLVLSSNTTGAAIWHTATGGSGATSFHVQPDSNLVLYKGTPSPATAVWASHSQTGTGPGSTQLEIDGGSLLLKFTPGGATAWRKPDCSTAYMACKPNQQYPGWWPTYVNVYACSAGLAAEYAKPMGATFDPACYR